METGGERPPAHEKGDKPMRYLFLLYGASSLPEPGTPEHTAMYAAYTTAVQAMGEAGVLVSCAPLQPASASTTVRVRDGQMLLTDGPAAELKEQFGGYTLVECADLDEALEWAARMPAASDGMVEVRPVIAVGAPA
jgi:hypothetical protein